jgi:serine/threonine-protein kinase HipA
MSTLLALLNDRVIGVIEQDQRGRFVFTYDNDWRYGDASYPISLSMPLSAREHPHKTVDAFLWGLLPDNLAVLDRWARQFQVSANNPFALLGHVGEDCAGAVQFVKPDRLDALLGAAQAPIEWLKEAMIAERLAALRADHAAWRSPRDTGQFSLAGAQPKTALLFQDNRWGIPSGRTPTTHILKPPTGEFDGHAENEHLCLRLAGKLGLAVARSRVMRFGDEVAIVIERYDREATATGIVRIHQEDLCQALAVSPTRKYENEGGPGAIAIAGLLRETSGQSREDVARFVDALIFNWLIGGTDAHAKNYSVLIGRGGAVRLAPLYDVASILPYDLDVQRVRLAMRIGGEYRLRDVSVPQWDRLNKDLKLDRDATIARIRGLAEAIPDTLTDVRKAAEADGLAHTLIGRLAEAIISRAGKCAALWDEPGDLPVP